MEKGKLICTCMDVYESEITKSIKDNKLLTAEEVGDVTGAGTVCGECIEDIEELLRKSK